MNSNKTSFLFFFIASIWLIGSMNNVFGQKQFDSTQYYVSLTQQPKTAKDLTIAYQYLKKRKEKALNKKDSIRVVSYLFYMASIEYKIGSYVESESTATEALKLLDYLNPSAYVFKQKLAIYNHLGMLYRQQNNDSLAFQLYDKAFQFANTAKDSATLYNNTSNIYKDRKHYSLAKTELLKAMSLVSRVDDTLTKARIMSNLGFVYSKLNEEEALPLLLKALKWRQIKDDSKSVYNSYSHLSEYYIDRLSIVQAKDYAVKAYDVALSLNSPSYIKDALGRLISINPNKYVRSFKRINDSILKADKLSQNKFALMKYNDSKKEKLIQKQQLESEKQSRYKLIYLFIAVFVILLSVVIFILITSRHKKEKLQEVFHTESRISKKVHDEVANDVYHIMTKLQHQAGKEEAILDDLEHVYNKTRDISRELNEIGTNEDYKELLIDLISHYRGRQTNIIIKGVSDIEWSKVKGYKKTVIYRVIQELLTNMKKHSNATLVVLNFNNDGHKIVINYKDNGVGCVLKKQNGLQNTENRMHAINGSITFKTQINEGFNALMNV